MSSEALTYVYCVVRSARRPATTAVGSAGIDGRAVRALDAGARLWLIATSVPRGDYDEAALARGLQNLDWVGRRAMAHEAVVERFLSAPAVLPMQLFTLFTSDERAIEHVTGNRRRIDRILSRVERKLEWGLRLTLDEKRAQPAAGRTGDTSSSSAKRSRQRLSGADYLAHKRDLLDASREQVAAARTAATRVYRALAREAAAARRRTATEQTATPGSRLLLDAAFLVERGRAAAFRSALRRHAKPLAAVGLVTSLTGPWPPYNFIDAPASRRRARTS